MRHLYKRGLRPAGYTLLSVGQRLRQEAVGFIRLHLPIFNERALLLRFERSLANDGKRRAGQS